MNDLLHQILSILQRPQEAITVQVQLPAIRFDLLGLAPDSSYASIWWIFGMWGIGIGLMLSPLTAAVLSATPPQRAGLGSSVNNTGRQVGYSLGVAVLGTVVVQQFSSNIASFKFHHRVPTIGAALNRQWE